MAGGRSPRHRPTGRRRLRPETSRDISPAAGVALPAGAERDGLVVLVVGLGLGDDPVYFRAGSGSGRRTTASPACRRNAVEVDLLPPAGVVQIPLHHLRGVQPRQPDRRQRLFDSRLERQVVTAGVPRLRTPLTRALVVRLPRWRRWDLRRVSGGRVLRSSGHRRRRGRTAQPDRSPAEQVRLVATPRSVSMSSAARAPICPASTCRPGEHRVCVLPGVYCRMYGQVFVDLEAFGDGGPAESTRCRADARSRGAGGGHGRGGVKDIGKARTRIRSANVRACAASAATPKPADRRVRGRRSRYVRERPLNPRPARFRTEPRP